MNNVQPTTKELRNKVHNRLSTEVYEGIYHSCSVNKSPSEVYAFCQRESNFIRALSDLPEKVKNFLELEMVQAKSLKDGAQQIEWRNKKSAEIQGTLILILSPAPADKGTVIIANALFNDYSMDNDEPSDLINLFLKRVKALAETGELATIKGQPNGKDEDDDAEQVKKSIKH